VKKLIYANVKEVSIINDGGEGLEGQEIDLKDTSKENASPLWKKKKRNSHSPCRLANWKVHQDLQGKMFVHVKI